MCETVGCLCGVQLCRRPSRRADSLHAVEPRGYPRWLLPLQHGVLHHHAMAAALIALMAIRGAGGGRRARGPHAACILLRAAAALHARLAAEIYDPVTLWRPCLVAFGNSGERIPLCDASLCHRVVACYISSSSE